MNLLSNRTQRYILQQTDGHLKKNKIGDIRKAVGELVKLDVGVRPMKMDLSAVAEQPQEETYTAAQWYAWENGEEGAGEEENPAYPGPPIFDALGKVLKRNVWQGNDAHNRERKR